MIAGQILPATNVALCPLAFAASDYWHLAIRFRLAVRFQHPVEAHEALAEIAAAIADTVLPERLHARLVDRAPKLAAEFEALQREILA